MCASCSDLLWTLQWPGDESVRGWRSGRVQQPPTRQHTAGREQLIASHWRQKGEDTLHTTLLSFCFYFYNLEDKSANVCVKRAYLRVREYRNDPSEDTITHQAAAVTMACPEGLPDRHKSPSSFAITGRLLAFAAIVTRSRFTSGWKLLNFRLLGVK